MRNRVSLGTVAVALLALAVPAVPVAAADTLRAGGAAADITPPIGTPMFAYTNRHAALEAAPSQPSYDADKTPQENLADNLANAQAGGEKVAERAMQLVADPGEHLYAKSFVPSRGIHQRLKARALVLEQDGLKYALVQTDLGGLPYALTNEVAKRVASAGIVEERLLISATHSHSATGPIWPADNNGYAALGGDLFDPRIFELTVQGVTEAILEAAREMRDAKLGVGTIELRGASRNRQGEAFAHNTDLPQDPVARKEAEIDPSLSVVRIDDKQGRPIGVWSNFAIHATSFDDANLLFSADNPGITEELVEAELSERAGGREVVNVWSNGNEGDISPNGGPDTIGGEPAQHVTSEFGNAYMAGRRVADGILRAWSTAGKRMQTAPEIGARMSYLNFDGTPADGEPVGPNAVLGGAVVSEPLCAPFDNMAGPGQGKKFLGVGGVGLVPNVHPVSMWKIGPLGVVAFGSEVTKQMGQRIRHSLEADSNGAYERVALAGLTNSYFSYTATPEEYDACYYEGAFTLFGRRQGARILDVAKGVNGALLSDAPAPAGIAPPAVGVGTTADVPPRPTPSAGTAVQQPAGTVERLGRATFGWNGGDTAVDAPRGADFVKVQRRTGDGWDTVLTDASFRDTTERLNPHRSGSQRDEYRETVQFDECDPTGTYRIVVTGRADKGGGTRPYAVTSETFELEPVKLTAAEPVVDGGRVRVKALYPNPGPEALMALPRIVTSGVATLRVTQKGKAKTYKVPAGSDGQFTVTAPGATSAEVVEIRDRCGNET